jgi:transcriptional regulator with XRE-family HTH domain
MSPTPLGRLIQRREKELGLRRAQLAALFGYQNIGKGCRRLAQISQGDLRRMEPLLNKLPAVLDLPEDLVTAAIDEMRRTEREHKEGERRPNFRPFAWIYTERNESGFIINFMRSRWVEFDASLPVEEIHRLVQATIERRQKTWTLSAATGYALHFTPDRSERFDLTGKPT